MKNEILVKLFIAKIMLLIFPAFKRQEIVDDLNIYVEKLLLKFNKNTMRVLRKQMNNLSAEECDTLFKSNFLLYRLLKFSNERIKVDSYHIEDCQTFEQFNRVLKLAFVAIDCEENLIDNTFYYE